MSQTTAYHVEYDIPKRSGIENPSARFRRLGFLSTLSGWIIPEGKMPWHYLEEFRARLKAAEPNQNASPLSRRGKCRWLKFTSDAAEIEAFARESIAEAIGRLVAQARQNLAKAQADYADQRDGRGMTVAEFEERVEKHLQKRIEELEETLEGAANFNVSAADTPAAWARNQIGLIERQSDEQAKQYVAAARLLRSLPTADAQAVAPAAEADAVPAGVVADLIEDAGGDATRLRAAFAPEPVLAAADAETDEWDSLGWE